MIPLRVVESRRRSTGKLWTSVTGCWARAVPAQSSPTHTKTRLVDGFRLASDGVAAHPPHVTIGAEIAEADRMGTGRPCDAAAAFVLRCYASPLSPHGDRLRV